MKRWILAALVLGCCLAGCVSTQSVANRVWESLMKRILFWWFLFMTASGSQVVGPFGNDTDCKDFRETVAAAFKKPPVLITACWNDG